MNPTAPLLFALAAAVWSGCATSGPAEEAEWRRRNQVLLNNNQALAALRQGRFEEARTLFDDTLTRLAAVRTGDRAAREAKSTFRSEDRKVFIGEPYERVMAWFYRGLIYWMQGELDNARACYRSGQLEDADAENRQYASDYVLLDYLDGYTSVKLAGDGASQFRRAASLSAKHPPPAYDKEANIIVFAEFGRGPIKYAAGPHGEQLRFKPGATEVFSAVLKVDGLTVPLPAYDDLHRQATTRGGRVMDHILANKAVFKETTDAFGDAALISGGVLAAAGSGSRSAADEVGLGLMAAGLMSKIFSSAANPAADTRMWSNLPQFLSFAALRLPPGQHTGTVEFLNAQGQPLNHFKKTVTFTAYTGRDTVLFLSDQNQ
jgi:tetratricopeptide (TPR) repeat protein